MTANSKIKDFANANMKNLKEIKPHGKGYKFLGEAFDAEIEASERRYSIKMWILCSFISLIIISFIYFKFA